MYKFFAILIIFFCSILFSEEFIKKPLKDPWVKQFLMDMLSTYWQRAELPYERLDDIFNILEKYADQGELAMLLLHEKYNDMADPTSSFMQNYKRARAKKFEAYARSLVSNIQEGILLDFGAGDTQLVTALVELNPSITHAYATDIFPYNSESMHSKVSFLQQEAPDSTLFKEESVNNIILSTVLHHINPDVRRSLIAHLYSILKPGGKIILVEDSYFQFSGTGNNSLENAFFKLTLSQKRDVLCFLDWWGNRLMKNRAEIPLPLTFKTIEEWISYFEDFGFQTLKSEFEGFPPIHTHMVSPKATMVFAKPINQPSSTATCNFQRAEALQKVKGILPKEGVKINVSIGGTNIIVKAVNENGEVFYAPQPEKWRDSIIGDSSEEKRMWFVKKIAHEIKAIKKNIANEKIEDITISWAGPFAKNGRIIGPNISGFSFADLNAEERALGGVDLYSLIKANISSELPLQLLNDADEEALSEFSSLGIQNGTLLILGTGIGAGFLQCGSPYYGPRDFSNRLGEIGHHIIYDNTYNSYVYYGLETKGTILKPHEGNRFTDRLSAPAVAKRFINFVYRELGYDKESVLSYFNTYQKIFLLSDFSSFLQTQVLTPLHEEKVLCLITEKAKENDDRAKRFIKAIGFEIGSAFSVFAKHFYPAPYLEKIHLGGSLGRLFGKDVINRQGKDLFLEAIELGLRS